MNMRDGMLYPIVVERRHRCVSKLAMLCGCAVALVASCAFFERFGCFPCPAPMKLAHRDMYGDHVTD